MPVTDGGLMLKAIREFDLREFVASIPNRIMGMVGSVVSWPFQRVINLAERRGHGMNIPM